MWLSNALNFPSAHVDEGLTCMIYPEANGVPGFGVQGTFAAVWVFKKTRLS